MKEFLFLGDSITDCGHAFDPENLGNGYVQMIAGYFKSRQQEICIHNMGVDGFTITALNRLWNLCCNGREPDFITILIGINDIAVLKNTGNDMRQGMLEFYRNYENLLEQILSETNCPILLMGPFIFPWPLEFSSWEKDVEYLNTLIETIAKKYSRENPAGCSSTVKYLPLQKALTEATAKYGYDAVTLDGVHLTNLGHRVIADLWLAHTQF